MFSQVNHWETVVFENDVWKYIVPSAPINSSWTTLGFNTSGWNNGQGGFGYGDGDDNTILPNGTLVCYQRIEFTIIDTNAVDIGALSIDYDDSFIAYLNGVEIARNNIAGSPPNWNQTASGLQEAQLYQGNYPPQFTLTKAFLSANLNQGVNVLAVEVHNRSAISSDLSSRVFLSLGINNTTTNYSSTPNWFNPPFVFTESNLPIVVINTVNNVAIPNEPKVTATMGIIYNGEGVMNYMNQPFNEFNGNIGIEIRGSSSASFPKKGYGVETRLTDSSNYNVSIFNWPADNDWVLYAPYTDKSLIRNVLTYKIGNEMGRYAPRTKLCEVVINGDYKGVYVFTEKIKQNPGRVNVKKMTYNDTDPDNITGGYVFKIDKTTSGGIIAWTSPYQQAPPSTFFTQYQVHDPSYDTINPLQINYLQNYVTDFETALLSPNFSDPVLGYEPFIDVGSFIDFMIVNEISKNVDGYRISTFYHKHHKSDGGLMVAGPLWDFNLAWGNANYCQGGLTSGWEIYFNNLCGGQLSNPFHWNRLVEDPDFTHALNCRWQELRQTKLHEDTLLNYIDQQASYLNSAAQRNFSRWQILGNYVWPNNFIGNTYQEEINFLKTWTSARLAWMDANMFGTCTDLGVNNNTIKNIDFLVKPNPSTGYFNIVFNEMISNKQIKIYNLLGELVYEKQINNTLIETIQTPNISKGIYILKVFKNNQIVGQQKIIKQ